MKAMVCKVQKLKGGKKSRAEAQRSAMENKPKEMKSEGFASGKWGSLLPGEESNVNPRAVWTGTDVKHK